MLGRSALSRAGGFRPENLGQNALAMIGNLCFTLFVVGVLVFTIIAATYEPEDPLFHPSTKMTSFLTSKSNATFKADDTVVKTGEDFMGPNQTAFATFINITDVENPENTPEVTSTDCDVNAPIDCKDPEVFHLMMKATIEQFKDIHFYKFGKPTPGSNDSTCDMAWRFRPKDGKTAAFYKDYRRFVITRSADCAITVAGMGEYHSGVNARKRKRNQKPGFEKVPEKEEQQNLLPVVGETVNDSLPVVESENVFSHGKYLFYTGGGDRCKSMNHYLWSFLCALGEAQYLNRTLVMDLSLCLSSIYTSSGQDEEGKDFRFYFDFEHLKESASVLDQGQFWLDWDKWQKKDGLTLNLVEDFRITPMKLAEVKDALIMRKFGTVEPDNYWYRVCEGETESVVQRPWHLLWKSRRLMDIVSAIATKLSVDTEVFLRGKKQIETFNDLTNDCKDGLNTCNNAAT
ncbi:uncharacterized protein LOC110808692 [Carica papaya]|uniref:uncharacterized protein LOC110808692 n=1 Tax=Carica papaya TaxID=3649 RepID=UPI000B8CCDAA|nr:uncharacterized protein LOC110808692 [Carica papaya]